ncbi:hypothetical protein GGH96_001549 [Coemansia sp. RSA 1972]|nr:hypothetical protein GGH96_001549 [Coemansia sp. RSA 1972]
MDQQTAFRRAEKQYKVRDGLLDLSTIIDLSDNSRIEGVHKLCLAYDLCSPSALPFQLFTRTRPRAYTIDGHPGLIIIPNPFTDEAQRWLARKCLCDCTRPPNRTNLDPFFELPSTSLFTLASEANNTTQSQCLIDSRILSDSFDSTVTKPKDMFYSQSASPQALLDRLRWCTLGWQYNWTSKLYDLGVSEFDPELNELMQAIAVAITNPTRAAANSCSDNTYDGTQYESHAGIINYYDERATMAGHVDKTEENMDAPLISFNIGLDCVYLIGGTTRDTVPTPVLLRSGDVLAMCGESRLAYHGVPKILANTSPAYLTDLDAGNNDVVAGKYPQWQYFAPYLSTHRVNCNARKCL